MNSLLAPRRVAVEARARAFPANSLAGGVISPSQLPNFDYSQIYDRLKQFYDVFPVPAPVGGVAVRRSVPIELFEINGDRSFMFRFDFAPQAMNFATYFATNIRNVLFTGSGGNNNVLIGEFIIRPMQPGKDRRKSTAQKFSSWREGEHNCLVGPIHDRLVAKVNDLEARHAAKPTQQNLSALNKFKRKMGITARVLTAVAETGASTDWVEYLCEQIEISVEVRSMISVYHRAKCQVCLSYIVDADEHVCGQDGSQKTLDSVTLYKCDRTRLCQDMSFVFVETRDAHVDYVGDARSRPTCFLSSHAESVVCDDLKHRFDALVAADTMFMFDLDVSGNVRKLMTIDGIPLVSEPLPFWDIHRDFLKRTGLDACFIDAVSDPELSSFVVASMGHNTTFDYPGFDHTEVPDTESHPWIRSIDIRRAYANVGLCEYYSGYMGKIHEFRMMDRMVADRNGIYWVTDVVVPDRILADPFMAGLFVEGSYPSPELRFWTDIGVCFRVVAGCVGSDLDFNYNDFPEMMEKHDMLRGPNGAPVGIRGYCLSTGVMQLRDLVESHRVFTGSGSLETFRGIPSVFVNEEQRTAVVTFPKSSAKHLCHVVSFIFSYVRIAVAQQVMAMAGSVVRVCVDGIYFDSRLYAPPYGSAVFDAVWSSKSSVNISNIPSSGYVCRDMGFTSRNLDGLSNRVSAYHTEELITGMGGNGKSHLVCTDVLLRGIPEGSVRLPLEVGRNGGLVRAMLFVPTIGQMKEKLADYPGVRVWTHAKLFNFIGLTWHPNIEEVRRWAGVLLFDECSMIPDAIRAVVVSKFPCHKIVWLGDVGYQCEPFPVAGEDGVKQHRPEFNPANVPYSLELTVNYRIKCPLLLRLAMELRRAIDLRLPPAAGSMLVRTSVARTTLRELRATYCKGDFVLCRTHQQISGVTKLLKDAFGQFKNSKNRLVSLDGRYARFDVVDYTDHGELTGRRSLMHCHGFTVHATQGATVKVPRRVIICMERDMELRVLYTAVTRCEYLHQLLYFDDAVSSGDWAGLGGGCDADGEEKEEEEDYAEAVREVNMAIEAAVVESWRRSVAGQVVPKRRQVRAAPPAPRKNRRITEFFK